MHLGSYNRVAVLVYFFPTIHFYDIKHIKSFENHFKSKNWRRKLRLVLDSRSFTIVFSPREIRFWKPKLRNEIIGMKNREKYLFFPKSHVLFTIGDRVSQIIAQKDFAMTQIFRHYDVTFFLREPTH